MKSVMKKDFARLPQTDIQRSTFDRSHGIKTAFDSGYLVPIMVDEVLPGDTFNLNATLLARLAPCVTPVMDNIFLDTQWFYCPSRLLWTNFTKMMGERINPKDSIDFLVPKLDSGSGFAVGSLADYFGIPTGVPNLKVSALPFRMMAKVWDDWYRDCNLQDSIIQSSDDLGDSNGTINWNKLYKRGKRHDYFTSCLAAPQAGAGVELPLGGSAPVYYEGATGTTDKFVSRTVNSSLGFLKTLSGTSEVNMGDGSFKVDLSMATAATINSLRMAFQIQRLLEADSRGGTNRYCSLIRQHFKTICPDARLQRSEYLGGSSQRIGMSVVAQSSSTDGTTPQGNLVANGKVVSQCSFKKSFTEHGYIIGLASVRVDLNYMQGLNRMWSRSGRYDFYWPTLAHLGEQAVLNKEIYAQGELVKDDLGNVVDDKAFGYQERYAEYRYKPSLITGRLRSTAPQSLEVWHLAQKFDKLPQLDSEFIEENPPLKRILSVQNEPEIIMDGFIGLHCTRPLPTYSIPGCVDHF